MSSRDPSSDQLIDYKKKVKKPGPLLQGNGAPIANKISSLTVGPRGPILMQDFVFIDEMSHFNQERIPERVVHAKGAGAFGYFIPTHDITKYSKAKVFSEIGKKTLTFVRFSTARGENGTDDLVRENRGFAVKFYTEQGIWDLLMINSPMFFINEPLLFPNMVHSQKRNPVTYVKDKDMYWDFLSLRPETTYLTLFTFSDRGIPDGYRYLNGHAINTFKLVNDKNESYWCRFHFETDGGIKNLTPEKAAELSATQPDYATKDLYDAIARGDHPSWSLSIQVMTPRQADTWRYNPFDATKIWPKEEFPYIPVGKLVLDKNPENYFADVEQSAFDPAHMPPGIEASPDKLLQGRLFAYGDTQIHRLGPNHLQLPVNCPYKNLTYFNYQRDGFMAWNNQGGAPNYFPNSFNGPVEDPSVREPSWHVSGEVDRHEPVGEDDYVQSTEFWRDVLNPDQRTRLVDNLVNDLKYVSVFIIERVIGNFSNVSVELGRRLTDGLRKAGVPLNLSGRSASL